VRPYEVVYIFDPQLAEEAIEQKLERYHQLLTQNGGGEITGKDDWGRRQLAYPIKKQTSGHYVVVQLTAAAESLPEFERLLKLDEELLRYLVVLHEGEPAAPMSIATRADRKDDDDEDEEE
jgi:small subunit ribosomal protein S6